MKKKTNSYSILWAIVFALSFTSSTYILTQQEISLLPSFGLIGFNAIIFIVYAIQLVRSIQYLDEVQIRIQLEAVTIAFISSLLLVMILGLVELVPALGIGTISQLYVFPAFFFLYIIGLGISKYRYS